MSRIQKGNWRWPLKDGALTQELAQRLRSVTMTSGRLRRGEPRVQENDPSAQITVG